MARARRSRAARFTSSPTTIDDVVDFIEQIADSFGLYKIEAPMDPSQALAQVLVDSTRQLAIAVGTLAHRRIDDGRDRRGPPPRERGRQALA